MATERLPMRKTREILRQKWVLKLTHREVTASLGVSIGAVSLAVHRALTAGLDWPAVMRSGVAENRTMTISGTVTVVTVVRAVLCRPPGSFTVSRKL